MLIKNLKDYPKNAYMKGGCPGCNDWEAPITTEELQATKEPFAHHGTGRKTIDKRAFYVREVWLECFQCPKCKTRFSVPFSST